MIRYVKTTVLIFVFLVLMTASCRKEKGDKYYGTTTIDNTLYGTGPYYALGFSFDLGIEVRTSDSPGPDITVHAITDVNSVPTGAYLDTPNLVESFSLVGKGDNENDAKTLFDNLRETEATQWMLFANTIEEHQVWLFKTSGGNYVKIRIVDLLVNEGLSGPYAEVTFEWRMQPDGSTTFSG